MLYLIRDKIVPKKWEEAKKLSIPKVTGKDHFWALDPVVQLILMVIA